MIIVLIIIVTLLVLLLVIFMRKKEGLDDKIKIGLIAGGTTAAVPLGLFAIGHNAFVKGKLLGDTIQQQKLIEGITDSLRRKLSVGSASKYEAAMGNSPVMKIYQNVANKNEALIGKLRASGALYHGDKMGMGILDKIRLGTNIVKNRIRGAGSALKQALAGVSHL